jgi:hypothetical protein
MNYEITLLLITKLNYILTCLVNPYNIQYEWPEKEKKKKKDLLPILAF